MDDDYTCDDEWRQDRQAGDEHLPSGEHAEWQGNLWDGVKEWSTRSGTGDNGEYDEEGREDGPAESSLMALLRSIPDDVGSDDEPDLPVETLIEQARSFVQQYYHRNLDEENRTRSSTDDWYRGSVANTIAEQTERLGRYLEEYDNLVQSSTWRRDFVAEDLWTGRIAGLYVALRRARDDFAKIEREQEALEREWQQGMISRSTYDDRHHELTHREQRTKTRLEMRGLGKGYEDIGDASDGAGHILEDAFSPDGGEMRKKISTLIRSMSRSKALRIINSAVARGIISESTADYLIREYVRSS